MSNKLFLLVILCSKRSCLLASRIASSFAIGTVARATGFSFFRMPSDCLPALVLHLCFFFVFFFFSLFLAAFCSIRSSNLIEISLVAPKDITNPFCFHFSRSNCRTGISSMCLHILMGYINGACKQTKTNE